MSTLDNLVAWRLMGEQQMRDAQQKEAERATFTQLMQVSQQQEARQAADFSRQLKLAQIKGAQGMAMGGQQEHYADPRLTEAAAIGANNYMIEQDAEQTAMRRKSDADRSARVHAQRLAYDQQLGESERKAFEITSRELENEKQRDLEWQIANLNNKGASQRAWINANSGSGPAVKPQDPYKFNNPYADEITKLSAELLAKQRDYLNYGTESLRVEIETLRGQINKARENQKNHAWASYTVNPAMFARPGKEAPVDPDTFVPPPQPPPGATGPWRGGMPQAEQPEYFKMNLGFSTETPREPSLDQVYDDISTRRR